MVQQAKGLANQCLLKVSFWLMDDLFTWLKELAALWSPL